MVMNSPAIQEIRVRFLGGENPLGEGTAPLSNILAWRIPWTEEPGGLQSMGCKESDTTEVSKCTHTHTHTHTLGLS